MIRFSLVCDKAHSFESWFRDSAAYEEQSEGGLLSCPQCGSVKIGKAIMAPQIARKDRERVRFNSEVEPAPQPMALISPEEAALRGKIRELRDALTRNSDYVGNRFAAEARKMHEGEAEQRAIHGEAKLEDVKSLLEDGIEVHPLPQLPNERN